MLVDARGLKCPLPVLKLRKVLEQITSQHTIDFLATDQMAWIDIELYCQDSGNRLLAKEICKNGDLLFKIQKK